MSGSAFMVWDLPLTVMVKRWLMAFSSLNKIAGPVAYGLTVPFADASAPTLAGERLVPQTSLANTWRINLVLTSPDQRPQGTCVEEEPRDAQPSREDCCWTLGGRRDRGFFFNSG